MHIGLIGGIGPAATAVYYRALTRRYAEAGRPLSLTINRNLEVPAMSVPARLALLVAAMIAGGAGLAPAAPTFADIYRRRRRQSVPPGGRSGARSHRSPAKSCGWPGSKAGMNVGDYLASEGYFSELLSFIVGPTGHVLLLNNAAYDQWSNDGLKARLAGDRLPNVEHQTINVEHLDISNRSLDALLVIKVYHDLYWVKPGVWPRIDTDLAVAEMARVVKPGGLLLLVDHSAKAGSGAADAGRIHRIDEAYARRDFENHGFHLVATSDILRHPEDPRDQITYEGPMVGKTDRFVMVFRRGG